MRKLTEKIKMYLIEALMNHLKEPTEEDVRRLEVKIKAQKKKVLLFSPFGLEEDDDLEELNLPEDLLNPKDTSSKHKNHFRK